MPSQPLFKYVLDLLPLCKLLKAKKIFWNLELLTRSTEDVAKAFLHLHRDCEKHVKFMLVKVYNSEEGENMGAKGNSFLSRASLQLHVYDYRAMHGSSFG